MYPWNHGPLCNEQASSWEIVCGRKWQALERSNHDGMLFSTFKRHVSNVHATFPSNCKCDVGPIITFRNFPIFWLLLLHSRTFFFRCIGSPMPSLLLERTHGEDPLAQFVYTHDIAQSVRQRVGNPGFDDTHAAASHLPAP